MTNPPPSDSLDRHDMWGAVVGLPDQIQAALAELADLTLPASMLEPEHIALLGMGGSAISGDLAAAMFRDTLRSPLAVIRDYRVPAWVGTSTLVIASSFSGNTEETLSALEGVRSRSLPFVAVTSGGKLADVARDAAMPLVRLPGDGQPRAAIGASLTSILSVLRAAKLIPDPAADLHGAVEQMKELIERETSDGDEVPETRRLARNLQERIPFVYAPVDLAPAARRWKTQLNENAKVSAVWEALPELNHNAVVGYRIPPDLGAVAHVVFLAAEGDSPRLELREQLTCDILDRHGIEYSRAVAPAGSAIMQALWLVLFGDLVSVHLARLHGVDPTPVEAIDRLKARLAEKPDHSA